MGTNMREVEYWLSRSSSQPDQWFDGIFHTWFQRSDGEQTDFLGLVETEDGTCIELDPVQIRFTDTDIGTTPVERVPDQCNCTLDPPTELHLERIHRIVHMEHSITLVLTDGRKYLYPSGSVIMFDTVTISIDYKKDKH